MYCAQLSLVYNNYDTGVSYTHKSNYYCELGLTFIIACGVGARLTYNVPLPLFCSPCLVRWVLRSSCIPRLR